MFCVRQQAVDASDEEIDVINDPDVPVIRIPTGGRRQTPIDIDRASKASLSHQEASPQEASRQAASPEAASPEAASSQCCAWSGAAIIAATVATVAELGIVTAAMLDAAPTPALAAAHVGIGLSLGLGLLPLSPRSRGNPAFLLFMICIIAMGPLGPLGTGLTVALRRGFARRATPFEEWYAALFPRITTTPTRTLYERIALRGGAPAKRSTVTPFLDIMALGTVQQKQAVIGMATEAFRPAFAPALRSALNDAEPAIRVQAATAFARLEGRFLNRSMMLQAARAERPDDADVILELARHHEECAESGLLDEGRAKTELTDALACCERVAAMRPGDRGVAEAAARLLSRLGRPEEAMLRLQPLAARSDASPGALTGYFACLFRHGQFGRLRDACHLSGRGIALAPLPNNAGEALRLWSEGPVKHAAPVAVTARVAA